MSMAKAELRKLFNIAQSILFIKKRQPKLLCMSREYAGSREPMKTDFNRGRVKRKYAFIRLLGMCTIGTVQ